MHTGDCMATATQRITVLVTPKEKVQIARMAKEAGLSMSEFLLWAAASYRAPEDDGLLDWMIDQMNESASRASVDIDDVLAFVEASNERIAKMERKAA